MNVAEKDNPVRGMLEEELQRCLEVLDALEDKEASYPKGSLNVRKKRYKDKEYVYHSLVFREGDQVVNRHIPDGDVPELKRKLEQRDKCRLEIKAYRDRIAYLEKLLRSSRQRKGSNS